MGTSIQTATRVVITVVAAVAAAVACAQLSVIETASGGPPPADLVQSILDGGSDYSLVGGSVSTAINTASGSYTTSPRATGSFSGGLTPAGTLLPAANQNATGDAVYAGGGGIASGICLCTGAASDSDAGGSLPSGFGIGAEGPNNGNATGANWGEVCVQLLGSGVIDQDFDELLFDGALATQFPSTGDPSVLQFRVVLQSPGFLRVRWVFASDEYPDWLDEYFNDAFAVLIKKDSCEGAGFENIAVFKRPENPDPQPFRLIDLADCDPPIFKQNQLSPAPSQFVNPVSPHAIDDTPGRSPYEYDTSIPYYDHEFGGFSAPRTSETPTALSPGTYTIKIVVHDVKDAIVDSALFIEANSLKLYPLNPGDYNGVGCVDEADFWVFAYHFMHSPATFYEGDGNGDCIVDGADYTVWRDHWGEGGNGDFSADFNRDGYVDAGDYSIWGAHQGLAHCASRFEGDADGDGDVDEDDYDQWKAQFGSCGCQQSAMSQSVALLEQWVLQQPEVVNVTAVVELVAEFAADAQAGPVQTNPADSPAPDLATP